MGEPLIFPFRMHMVRVDGSRPLEDHTADFPRWFPEVATFITDIGAILVTLPVMKVATPMSLPVPTGDAYVTALAHERDALVQIARRCRSLVYGAGMAFEYRSHEGSRLRITTYDKTPAERYRRAGVPTPPPEDREKDRERLIRAFTPHSVTINGHLDIERFDAVAQAPYFASEPRSRWFTVPGWRQSYTVYCRSSEDAVMAKLMEEV